MYDIAKCLAIISVLLYHIEFCILHNIYINAFLNTFFLSIFFVISGLLSNSQKVSEVGWLEKQASHLILPFIVGFTLYNIYLWLFWERPLFEKNDFGDSKSGFWFLLTLFEFFLVVWAVERISMHGGKKPVTIRCFLLCVPFFIVTVLCKIIPYDIAGILSLMSFRRYYLFFAYGYIINNCFHNPGIFYNKMVGIVSSFLYLFLATYFTIIIKEVSTPYDFMVWLLANTAGCHFWLYMLKQIAPVISHSSVIMEIGQNTLGIYVIHYYILQILIDFCHRLPLGGGIYKAALYIVLVTVLLSSTFFCVKQIKKEKILSLVFLGVVPDFQNYNQR